MRLLRFLFLAEQAHLEPRYLSGNILLNLWSIILLVGLFIVELVFASYACTNYKHDLLVVVEGVHSYLSSSSLKKKGTRNFACAL